MLRWRLASASVILLLLLSLLWLDLVLNFGRPGIWLVPLLLAMGLMATDECLDLLQPADQRPAPWAVHVGTMLVIGSSCLEVAWPAAVDSPLGRWGWPLAALATGLVLVFVAEMWRYQPGRQATTRVSQAMLVICYVGLLSGFLATLRQFHGNHWGMAALISMILVAKTADAGAYACGRMFGQHQLTPTLSPGKTIEGALGGLIVAAAASLAYFWVVVPWIVGGQTPPTAWWAAVLYALLVAAAGMVGDLAESMLKRDAGKKDSSRWLPGLGGVLDVIDSVLMAAPAALLAWLAGLVGP